MTDLTTPPLLTSLAHGGGCGCKLDPSVLNQIIERTPGLAMPAELIVDASTRDDAAVYRLGDDLAIVATTLTVWGWGLSDAGGHDGFLHADRRRPV